MLSEELVHLMSLLGSGHGRGSPGTLPEVEEGSQPCTQEACSVAGGKHHSHAPNQYRAHVPSTVVGTQGSSRHNVMSLHLGSFLPKDGGAGERTGDK